MKKSEVRENLFKYIQNENYIEIYRSKFDKNSIQCIPLVIGKKLLLLGYYYDFTFDGYKILRIKDITKIKFNEVDKFAENILRKEGLVYAFDEPLENNLDNFKDIFSEILKLDLNIMLEDEQNGIFLIGKVVDINKNSVDLLNFNAVGEWDKEPKKIFFKDITLISFKNKYTTLMSKYLK